MTMTSSQLRRQACAIFAERSNGQYPNGYTLQWQDNLLPGITADLCEADLLQGSGDELNKKFCALHSSSALAVNTFAPFKNRLNDLIVLENKGFQQLNFEKKLPTGLGGTPPNLDIFLQREDEVIAIESKFLEYFTAKQAVFSDSYTRKALPQAEDCWWEVLEASKQRRKQYLDVAQLVKHALGLLRYKEENKVAAATLLYLFWEPTNAAQIAVCQQHREQIKALASQVAPSAISFRWMSYNELWQQWQTIPALQQHTSNLLHRYAIEVK
jgi:hypothetical protein